jgi:predicted O-methyltransferase YrrM
MSVTKFLNDRGYHYFEGNCEQVPEQIEDLIHLISNVTSTSNEIKVMEIGFNAGHSADVFLRHNPKITLTSFDLGDHSYHQYIYAAKEFIDLTHPNRHTLILGDSTITVPQFIDGNKDIKFDFIFIDGGHDYEIAKADMENCFQLAHPDTIVVLDDTIFRKDWETGWTIGPSQTWSEHLEQKKILELGRKEYREGRGMVWGKYLC